VRYPRLLKDVERALKNIGEGTASEISSNMTDPQSPRRVSGFCRWSDNIVKSGKKNRRNIWRYVE